MFWSWMVDALDTCLWLTTRISSNPSGKFPDAIAAIMFPRKKGHDDIRERNLRFCYPGMEFKVKK